MQCSESLLYLLHDACCVEPLQVLLRHVLWPKVNGQVSLSVLDDCPTVGFLRHLVVGQNKGEGQGAEWCGTRDEEVARDNKKDYGVCTGISWQLSWVPCKVAFG